MKNDAEIAAEIRLVIARQLRVALQTLSDDKHLVYDLGADSLDFFDLGIELENMFGLVFDESDIVSMNTVGDVVARVLDGIGAAR
ncbi:hypothetical protein VL15_14820 [Burkholderia cepacia]|uniref:Carrier domain-containing protein n=1 Tax=Burkholderia cepacia TaxID=292 RepID=A0A0J5X1T7_BURCE|nr:acyl carrier protein [Burkholderia cepacia]KML57007.1 hypothetical protein VL15_14820 [Burkholderia cepacia]